MAASASRASFRRRTAPAKPKSWIFHAVFKPLGPRKNPYIPLSLPVCRHFAENLRHPKARFVRFQGTLWIIKSRSPSFSLLYWHFYLQSRKHRSIVGVRPTFAAIFSTIRERRSSQCLTKPAKNGLLMIKQKESEESLKGWPAIAKFLS